MDRLSKAKYLEKISSVLSFSFLVVVNFSGITAAETFALRKELKAGGGGMIVAKNTLACIALSKRSDLGFLEGEFVGPVLLIYSDDVVGVSKVIAAFSKKNKSKMVVKCAAYEKVKLKREDVARFASLQSLDHVRVQLMRLIAFNINARLVRCLNYIGEQNKD